MSIEIKNADDLFKTAKELFLTINSLTEDQRLMIKAGIEAHAAKLMETDEAAENDANVLEGVILTLCFDLLLNFDWKEVNNLVSRTNAPNSET